MNYNRKS